MSLPLLLGCVWVVLATITAFLPFRVQFIPGFLLLVAAPVLLVWIGRDHGWIFAGLGLLGFLSMFRRPLLHLMRRIIGKA